MKKVLIYYVWGLLVACACFSSCSEDELVADPANGETMYDPEGGEEGSVGAAIDAFYEKYGTKILYDFKESDLAFNWNRISEKWFVPADQSGDYIQRMVTNIDEALSDYPASFVKKFFPYRIFLVDSICDRSDYKASALEDVLELGTHAIAVAHVGKDMDDLSDDDWTEIKSALKTSLVNSILNTTGAEPTEFISLCEASFMEYGEPDPEGEFTDTEYGMYKATLVGGSVMDYYGYIFIMRVDDETDFGSYVSFLMSKTKTYMDRVFTRFPKVKKRATLVYQFMLEYADTDLIEFQNQTCPDDPLPANYFNQ